MCNSHVDQDLSEAEPKLYILHTQDTVVNRVGKPLKDIEMSI